MPQSPAPRPDVAIASVGRFHYDALATGLHRLGRLDRFYSGLPRGRLRCPEIPAERIDTSPWLQVPYMALCRYPLMPPRLIGALARWSQQALDRHIARRLPDCALYAAMSGCGLRSGAEAQRRGIRYVCERGAAHIRYNDDLLRAEHDAWGLPYRGSDPRMMALEEAEYAQADRLVVISETSAETFVRRGVPRDKIRVVHPIIRTRGQRGGGARGPGFRVLFVGALSLAKGVGHLARAFRQAALADATLVLAGPSGNATERLLEGLETARVERLGPLSHRRVLEEMGRAHLLVLPSLSDGLGLVVLEALACGCPVIVSDACGASELVEPDGNALVVPARDEEALAAALTRLYEDRDLLRRLSEAAPTVIGGDPSPEAYAARWLAAVSD